jgi:hypothetical protein
VGEVTVTFLGQGPVPLTGQHKRMLEELVEHGRTSLDDKKETEKFDRN